MSNYTTKTLEILEKYKNKTPVPILKIAKELSLKVFKTDDFTDNQSGLIRKEGDDYCIYVNQSHSSTRMRFTIAHEIAHYLEHILPNNNRLPNNYVTLNRQSVNGDDEQSEDEQKMEAEANKLAAKLLMPEKKFAESWEKAKSIEEVSSCFDVSVSAVAVRGTKLFKQMII